MLKDKSERVARQQAEENVLNGKILEETMKQQKSDKEEQIRKKLERKHSQLAYMQHLKEQVLHGY